MKKLFLGYILIFTTIVFGCSGNSDVSLVKEGTMQAYQSTTIGNAFDASFDSPKWEAVKGKKGERVVQFTGMISKDLHNSVVTEIANARRNTDPNIQIQLFSIALQKIMGSKYEHFADGEGISFLQGMNKKFNCKGISWPGGNYPYPNCENESKSGEYLNATVDELMRIMWSERTPVEVQWVVTPDGDSFNLSHMGSAAWEGVAFEEILKVIYK